MGSLVRLVPLFAELFVDLPSPSRRRILLESILASRAAQASAIWIRASGTWRPSEARGPAGLFPPDTSVGAALAGDLTRSLPGRTLVLVPASPAGDVGLVLAGVQNEDDPRLDVFEALLVVERILDDGTGPGAALPQLADDPRLRELRRLVCNFEERRDADDERWLRRAGALLHELGDEDPTCAD